MPAARRLQHLLLGDTEQLLSVSVPDFSLSKRETLLSSTPSCFSRALAVRRQGKMSRECLAYAELPASSSCYGYC